MHVVYVLKESESNFMCVLSQAKVTLTEAMMIPYN